METEVSKILSQITTLAADKLLKIIKYLVCHCQSRGPSAVVGTQQPSLFCDRTNMTLARPPGYTHPVACKNMNA